jgi:hypothetical protein
MVKRRETAPHCNLTWVTPMRTSCRSKLRRLVPPRREAPKMSPPPQPRPRRTEPPLMALLLWAAPGPALQHRPPDPRRTASAASPHARLRCDRPTCLFCARLHPSQDTSSGRCAVAGPAPPSSPHGRLRLERAGNVRSGAGLKRPSSSIGR